MIDRQKAIEAFTRCGTPGACSDKCAYFSEGFNCYRAMKRDLLELLKEPQWHPFDPMEPKQKGLEDHHFYLVTVKGYGTPMKAKYHIDKSFGFEPPTSKDFDPFDVIAWRELPEVMNDD